METDNLICPLAKDNCIEESCAWFCRYTDCCSIVSLARSLEYICSEKIKAEKENAD